LTPDNSDTITIYTDGSCHGNPGPGGYAAVVLHGDERKEISDGYRRTTNNRMEIMGAVAALESLKAACRVMVYSDSAYLVNAMNGRWPHAWQKNGWRRRGGQPALNPDLWKRLLGLCETHRVAFKHVRAHRNNVENNRCDALANAAASRSDLAPDPGYASAPQQKML
jgi:ribonuclease HI